MMLGNKLRSRALGYDKRLGLAIWTKNNDGAEAQGLLVVLSGPERFRNWNARASARKGPERFKEILIIKLYNQLGVCMLIPYIIPFHSFLIRGNN